MFTSVNLLQDRSAVSNYISSTLLREIEAVFERWEKTLLYLNKRGSHSSLICEDCQHLFECPNCDVSLSVHSSPEHLMCHICTHKYNIPLKCKECQSSKLKNIGIGTQQIEKVLREYYPEKSIYRFDSDSVRNISSKKQALQSIENADIVIGTKMLTTGFNFENLGCIWVILVESELWYPSYDAEERAYMNLRQLIGRGNRKTQKTQLILQTFIPNNPTIRRLTQENYKDFFSSTLSERKEFSYPPYREMVTLEYRHKKRESVNTYLQKLSETLRQHDNTNTYIFLLGSNPFKKNNSYHGKLIIRGEDIRSLIWNISSIILREKSLSVIFQ